MEVLEVEKALPKKTYKKHTFKRTLGVKAYLNTRLKGRFVGGKNHFPIYWQITFDGKTTQMKSESFGELGISEEDFLKDNLIIQKLEREKVKIETTFWQIINHYETKLVRILSINEIIDAYTDIYKKTFVDRLAEHLNTYLNLIFTIFQGLEYWKKKKLATTISLLDFIENDENLHLYGTYSINGSPKVNLDIISIKHPSIKDLVKDIPAKAWILKEIIDLVEQIPNEERGFVEAEYNYNGAITWYDIETGKLKRFLNLAIDHNFLNKQEVDEILVYLTSINHYNFSELAEDFYSQDEMEGKIINYIKKYC